MNLSTKAIGSKQKRGAAPGSWIAVWESDTIARMGGPSSGTKKDGKIAEKKMFQKESSPE